MKRAILAAAVAALSFVGLAQENFASYAHKAYVTFNYTGETPLENFTALVKVADGDGGFSYSACRADGQDVRFAGGDDVELPSEVGAWNPSGTSEFWVKIPVLTAPTRICMYWGNDNAGPRGDVAKAWDKNYAGVWHFDDEGAAVKDSSSYRNHGATGFVSPGEAGMSGKCRTFVASDNKIAACGVGTNPEFLTGAYTHEVWFKYAEYPADGVNFFMGYGKYETGYWNKGSAIGVRNDGSIYFNVNGSVASVLPDEAPVALNAWHHLALCEDETKAGTERTKLYYDGQLIGSWNYTVAWPVPFGGGFNFGGNQSQLGGWYDKPSGGTFDEGRVSMVQRSADYVAAVYTNIADYVNFVAVEANPATVVELATTPAKSQYKVTITAGEGGEVSPSGDVFVEDGSDLVVTATATDAAKALYAWSGDCPEEQMFASSIVVRVDKPMTLTASFGTIHRVTADGGVTALTNAIDQAADGDVVLIGKGTYAPDGTDWQINVAKPIAVRAEEGPGSVVFELAQSARGISVRKAGAVVEGFVISQAGNATTGYVLNQTAGQVNDCVFSGTTNTSTYTALSVSGGRMQRCVVRNLSFSTGNGATRKMCNLTGATVVADGCVFTNNIDNTIYGASSATVVMEKGATLRNSLVAGNTYANGDQSGVHANSTAGTFLAIENCTIANNAAKRGSAAGAGIYDGSGYTLVVNTIVEGNTVPTSANGANLKANVAVSALNSICPELSEADGCVQDSAKFINAEAGDYRLANDSPAIDAGCATADLDDSVARDAAGNKRIRNKVLDIGALENWPTTLTVAGEPFEMGAPTPAYGSYACYDFGETIACSAPAKWTSDDGLTTADCIGYRLERGGAVTTGEDNFVVLTASNDLQTLTWLWAVHSPLEADDPVYVSSSFGSAIVSANVTGFGKGTKASVAFRYGTNPNALGSLTEPVEVTELGTVEISLPLIRNGLTYYVKVVLTNDAGETFESEDAIPFTQPEVDEEGMCPTLLYANQTALIGHWDGFENAGRGIGDASAAIWADLTGITGDLTVNSVATFDAANGCLVRENQAIVGSDSRMAYGVAGVTNWKSVEVVVKRSSAPFAALVLSLNGHEAGVLGICSGARDIGSNFSGYFESPTFADLEFVTMALVKDASGGWRFYENGVERAKHSRTEGWSSNMTAPLAIGGRAANNANYLLGRVYGLRIYSNTLSADEIKSNAALDNARFVAKTPVCPLKLEGEKFVLTMPASTGLRTVLLCSGKAYGGTNGWTTASAPVTLQPGETTASFDLPTGWGTDALYARAKIVEGGVTYWSATAFWEDPDGFVAVKGAPEELRADEVSPRYGRLSVVAGGVTEMTAPASTVTMEDGSHVFIGGWELYTKNPTTGEMELVRTSESPLDGESASKCLYTHEHYSELVWIWRRQDCITVASGENGSVDQSEVWADRGDTVTVTATADPGYRFLKWEGNLTDGERVINPLLLEVRGAASATAVFAPEVAPRTPSGEDFSSYAHRAYVTFNHEGGAVTNYTALVKVRQGDGGFGYDACRADGQDVRFSLGDGEELPSEVGVWNPSGTSEFWVKIPELKPQTRILMYWGNADAGPRGDTAKVWDRYAGVWHMDDEGAVVKDSSSYRNHGASGFVSPRNAGVAGVCRTFDVTKSLWAGCGAGYNPEFVAAGKFTYEIWFKDVVIPDGMAKIGLFGWGTGDWNIANFIGVNADGGVHVRSSSTRINVTPESGPIASGVWHHLALAADSAKSGTEKVKLYLDGELLGGYNFNPTVSAGTQASFQIGGWLCKGDDGYYDTGKPAGGSLDEGRVSTVQRSADYVAAVYRNIADYANFVTIEYEPERAAGFIGETLVRDEVGDGVRYAAEEGIHVFADGVEVKEAPSTAKLVALSTSVKKEYKVTIEAGEGGAVEPSGELWVAPGSNLVVTATATDAAKAFYGWTGDCPEAQLFASSIVVRVDKPMTLTANFGNVHRVTAEGGVTALTNAVALAEAGDVVLVGKGTYAPDGTGWQINVAKPIAVRAEEGPGSVVFEFAQSARGISVTKAGAVVEGFVVSQAGSPTAGYVLNQTAGQVNDCVFSGATNSSSATAVNVAGGRLQRCVVRDIALTGGNGASSTPCVLSGGSTVIDGCVFRKVSVGSNWSGCANVTLGSGATIRNSLVADCSRPSDYYAGVRANGSVNALPLVENCTIVHNSAGHADSAGAGLFDANQRALVVNTIIEGNTVKQAAKGMNVNISKVTAALNTICLELPEQNGCKQVEAGFKDAANGDYSIDGTSPAVDAGSFTASALDPSAADVAGAARVYGKAIDIGAYEYAPKGDEPLACSFDMSAKVGVDTLTVAFTPVVVGKTDGITYLWTFGDGTTSTEASPTHVYLKPGNFTVKLEVATYDGETLIESASKEMSEVIRVLPSKVYVRPTGTSTPTFPYDTVETAANDFYTISSQEYASGLVIDVDGTVARGTYTADFKEPVKIVGHSPETSVISHGNSGVLMMNTGAKHPASSFEIRNVKIEVSGSNNAFAGRILETCGIVSNCVFKGKAVGTGNNSGFSGAVRLLAGSRMIDSTVEQLAGKWNSISSKGIEIAGGGVIVDRCVVRNVTDQCGSGATLPTTVGVTGVFTPAPIIRNCYVAHNVCEGSAAEFGAIGLLGPAVVENCTIVSNVSRKAGSGIVVKAAGAVIRNNIIWDNVSPASVAASNVFVAAGIDCTFERNCSVDLKDVADNIAADPQLNWSANPKLPPYAIGKDSPCRNRGKKEAWMDGATDLDGQRRSFNGRPDIGCYENQVGGTVIIVR